MPVLAAAEPEPAAEPMSEPEPAAEPIAEPEPMSEPPAEPIAEPEPMSEPEPIDEPIAEPDALPAAGVSSFFLQPANRRADTNKMPRVFIARILQKLRARALLPGAWNSVLFEPPDQGGPGDPQ